MIWREPSNHQDDCYFCINTGTYRRNRSKWIYPNLQSAIRPALSSSDESLPESPLSRSNSTSQELTQDCDDGKESNFYCPSERRPYDQNDLDNLIRDLTVSKKD